MTGRSATPCDRYTVTNGAGICVRCGFMDSQHVTGRVTTPLLCRFGMHASRYGDGCKCWSASRCNRCHTSRDPKDAARVDECRRLVGAGQHPDGPCQGGAGRG